MNWYGVFVAGLLLLAGCQPPPQVKLAAPLTIALYPSERDAVAAISNAARTTPQSFAAYEDLQLSEHCAVRLLHDFRVSCVETRNKQAAWIAYSQLSEARVQSLALSAPPRIVAPERQP
ncbi:MULTISPECIES: hypothetical protein [unclassified Undibacterium]|uniref:hypothetical protein n=1 Tax=unclassified Undibacterium TaxID=2630295 RepID=UPI002AC986AE|nr:MULTISPECIES: hypothetical protein [unclassified Undibacterium]MEB0139996.1 hypothetical protein [Undibacterium sp. CCC2.1]MEB0173016.1 hypothetical protein [Undibacterium sp. CCC1.1]MEB0176830.1 hypothetical protein [Undibacterium sp. CCC3.4]MEB0216062.1 hypothetical protein [Undibacterium sp. 5I2]WPX42208.1 hypothetical protein RHM61_12465 [Undibacterium sp. CCC3.4]